MKITATNELETKEFAKKFASKLKSGDIVCLHGELGAGKTTFVKGLAEGLGIEDDITSPTFALMNVYEIKKARKHPPEADPPLAEESKKAITNLIHIDTYRLKTEQELIEIGVEDYLGQDGTVTVVEWPEKINGLLKNIRQRRTRLWREKIINIHIDHSGVERIIISNIE